MPFSFNPGQQQEQAAQAVSSPQVNSNGVPLLNVPVAPTISLAPVVEPISPFAYKNRSKSKFGVYFQGVLFIIFFSLALASIVLFSYQTTIKVQIASRKADLDKLQATYVKPKELDDMKRLSSRLALINKIINERASVNTAFKIIEDSINGPVVYNKFSLSKSKKDNNYDLSFAGETNSYSALYQQVEVLNSSPFKKVFPKLFITGIGPLSKNGLASFKVDASIAINKIDPEGFSVIKNSTSTIETSSTIIAPPKEVSTTTKPVTP